MLKQSGDQRRLPGMGRFLHAHIGPEAVVKAEKAKEDDAHQGIEGREADHAVQKAAFPQRRHGKFKANIKGQKLGQVNEHKISQEQGHDANRFFHVDLFQNVHCFFSRNLRPLAKGRNNQFLSSITQAGKNVHCRKGKKRCQFCQNFSAYCVSALEDKIGRAHV